MLKCGGMRTAGPLASLQPTRLLSIPDLGLHLRRVSCAWSVDTPARMSRLHSLSPKNCLLATLQAQEYASLWKDRSGGRGLHRPWKQLRAVWTGQGFNLGGRKLVLVWEGHGPRTARAGASPACV